MAFCNEKDFENHIRELLESEIVTPHCGLTMLEYTGVADIIVCRKKPQAVFFIEVKYEKGTNGISVSEGIQSEVLSKMPPYINDHFMWLIGSQRCDGRYWLLDSSELVKFVPTIDLTKQNNIGLRIFRERLGLTREELVNQLRERLCG